MACHQTGLLTLNASSVAKQRLHQSAMQTDIKKPRQTVAFFIKTTRFYASDLLAQHKRRGQAVQIGSDVFDILIRKLLGQRAHDCIAATIGNFITALV